MVTVEVYIGGYISSSSYLAPYSLTEFMIEPTNLLWYDRICVDKESMDLLHTPEKETLIQKKYRGYFKDDPNKLLRRFVEILENEHILSSLDVPSKIGKDGENLIRVLNEVDEYDKEYSHLVGRHEKWMIERCNRILTTSASLRIPHYDTWAVQQLYRYKELKPSFAIANSIWKDKPNLLTEAKLPKMLSEADSHLSGQRSEMKGATTNFEGGLRIPSVHIDTLGDLESLIPAILSKKERDQSLMEVKRRFVARAPSVFAGTTEAAEGVRRELGDLMTAANREMAEVKALGEKATVGAMTFTLASIIFSLPQIVQIIGPAILAGLGLSNLAMNRNYGWLYYLHNLEFF